MIYLQFEKVPFDHLHCYIPCFIGLDKLSILLLLAQQFIKFYHYDNSI